MAYGKFYQIISGRTCRTLHFLKDEDLFITKIYTFPYLSGTGFWSRSINFPHFPTFPSVNWSIIHSTVHRDTGSNKIQSASSCVQLMSYKKTICVKRAYVTFYNQLNLQVQYRVMFRWHCLLAFTFQRMWCKHDIQFYVVWCMLLRIVSVLHCHDGKAAATPSQESATL